MSLSGAKRKGAPALDVLEEERTAADPNDVAAGTLRGETMFTLPCPTPPDPLIINHSHRRNCSILPSAVFLINSRWKACT